MRVLLLFFFIGRAVGQTLPSATLQAVPEPNAPVAAAIANEQQVPAQFDLALLQSTDRQALAAGESLTLRLEVQNLAQHATATAVRVQSKFHGGIKLRNSNCAAKNSPDGLVWDVGRLPARSRIVCQFQIASEDRGRALVRSQVDMAEVDTNAANNQAQLALQISVAQLPWVTRLTISALAGLLTLLLTLWLFARKY